MRLAPRLLIGVDPSRPPEQVRAAIEGWLRDSIRSAGSGSRGAWVAVVDGAVVGFVSVAVEDHWSGQTDAWVGELMVDEGFERRGLARSMLTKVEAWATERGLSHVRLTTGAANLGALAFYERLGYGAKEVTLTRELSPAPDTTVQRLRRRARARGEADRVPLPPGCRRESVLGGVTSYAQSSLPAALSSFANSASGWTILCALLVVLAGPRVAVGAGLGAASFVCLVLGYTAASHLRGFAYAPASWILVAVVAGPVVGAAAAAVTCDLRVAQRSWVGSRWQRSWSPTEPAGSSVLGASTSPVYWTLVIALGLALVAWVSVSRRSRRR